MAGKDPFYPDGHYYSPIGKRRDTKQYFNSEHYQRQIKHTDDLMDYPAHAKKWATISKKMIEFPFEPAEGFRYFAKNNQLPYFDASILSGMIQTINPTRVIEIGAGFSTAAMFDTFDRMENPKLQKFTTIDIDLTRAKGLNPPDKCEMIEAPVQTIDPAFFGELKSGDLLFIDTSHVLKTGSDVHYEYLHILPAIAKGVHVHIHDIHYPFEYRRQWAQQENRSWNEVYLVDMLLTFSKMFKVEFFNDAFLQVQSEDLRKKGDMLDRFDQFDARPFNRGTGSIWLKKVA